MLELKEIRPYSVQTLSIIGTILSWARAERLHKDSVTVDTMDVDVQLWLARKGIDQNHLKEIEQLAGSLARGLLMILHSLPRHETGTLPQKRGLDQRAREEHQSSQKRVRCHELFDVDAYQKVQAIVDRSTNKKEEEYTQRLESLAQQSSLVHPPNPSSNSSEEEASLVDLLTGTRPPDPITLNKVRSVILRQQSSEHPSLTEEDRLLDSRLDVDVVDIIPLCKEAIDLGILEPNISWRRQKDRPKVHNWRDEAGIFHGKEYEYHSNPDQSRSRSIYVNYCLIVLPKGKDIGNGTIWVTIEIEPPGKKHPQCYATAASDQDPANRLAFKLRYQPSHGPEVQEYGHRHTLTSTCTANTFVDILSHNKPNEEIARTPRRYLYFGKESHVPLGLERFRGGAFTEGSRS
jgi:hypothetical protein